MSRRIAVSTLVGALVGALAAAAVLGPTGAGDAAAPAPERTAVERGAPAVALAPPRDGPVVYARALPEGGPTADRPTLEGRPEAARVPEPGPGQEDNGALQPEVTTIQFPEEWLKGSSSRRRRALPAAAAAALLAELVRRDLLDPRVLEEIVLHGTEPGMRGAALTVLRQAGAGRGLLVELLDAPAARERELAREVLLRTQDPADRPLLLETLAREDAPPDESPYVEVLAELRGRGWGPEQMVGAPDTPATGDLRTAWASKRPDMGEVWVEVDFEQAVRPDGVRIRESFNPGAITRIEARVGDRFETLWSGRASPAPAPSFFEPPIDTTAEPVRTLRIVLDTDRVKGWNEIDAVELLGDGIRQWASAARASTTYAGDA